MANKRKEMVMEVLVLICLAALIILWPIAIVLIAMDLGIWWGIGIVAWIAFAWWLESGEE